AGEHLPRRVDPRPALLEVRVPGRTDASEQRDLFAPQPGQAPSRPGREPDVLGTDPVTAAAQEPGQLFSMRPTHNGGLLTGTPPPASQVTVARRGLASRYQAVRIVRADT